MPKNLEDIAFKGWCRANLALLSKSIKKEMSVLELFKNLTTKSIQMCFEVNKSNFHIPQDLQNEKNHLIVLKSLCFNILKMVYFRVFYAI